MSSYRPTYNGQRDSRNHRDGGSGRSRRSPLARRDPPPMYQFGGGGGGGGGGDSYRPGQSHDDRNGNRSGRDRPNDFTFRAGNDRDVRFPAADPSRIAGAAHRRAPRDNRRPRHHNQPGRVWRPPPAPHERPILQSTREKTPEQFGGMNDGSTKFISLSDVSDSEAEMELESQSEDDQDTPDRENGQPAAKKARVTSEETSDADAVPRWSNPDPYTSLPPPDESQTKKRDFVKLIRKAKVASDRTSASNAVTQNADFISLNFDDDDEQKSDDEDNASSDDERRAGASSANTPRFSHLDNLHPNRSVNGASENKTSDQGKSAPVVPQTAASLGPPPTLSQVQSYAPISGLDTWPPPPPPPKSSTSGKLEPLPPPPSKGKKRKRDAIDGSVVEEWAPRAGAASTPWCRLDHSATENMGLWLHKEIVDFYDYVRPHEVEQTVRLGLIDRISNVLETTFPSATVCSFGSFASGLYLPTADMDLVLVSRQFINSGAPQLGQSRKQLFRIASLLEKGGVTQPGSTEVIAGARVPIIKLVDRVTGLKVDMSFENNTGIVANNTFQEWKAQYPAMPVIATLVKQFLAMRGLNEVFLGGLGGFSVICMVVHYLQQLPAAQSGNMLPERHLGDIFMGFLFYYGHQFNIYNTRIALNPPGLLRKGIMGPDGKPTKPDRLSIIDPNKSTNDISSGSHNVEMVLACFRKAYDSLQFRMSQISRNDRAMRKSASILQAVFAGNYSSFEWQRDRLRKVHDSR